MKIGTTGLKQVCLVVWDLEKAEKAWSHILGMKAEHLFTPPFSETPSYTSGKADNFSEEFILYRLENDVIIEIFGPGKGTTNPWRTHLEKHGEGVMNLGIYAEPPSECAYEKIGEVCSSSKPYHEGFYEGCTYSFVDTAKELGVQLNVKFEQDNKELIKRCVNEEKN